MAGYITATEFRMPTDYVKAGAGAAWTDIHGVELFPHSHAADITHPHRPWRSLQTVTLNQTFYGVDFGEHVELAGVGIDNVNVQALVLEAALDPFYTSSLLQLPVIISENKVERGLYRTATGPLGRLKAFVDLKGTDFEGEARRYWRLISAVTQPVTAVAGEMEIGSVAWCTSLTRWASGTSSYGEQPIEATRLNDDFAGGGAEPVVLGNPYAAITLTAAPAALEMREPLLSIMRQGLGRPILFYRNNGDTADFYICHRATDVSVRTTSPNTIEFDQLILRSVV